MPGILVGVETEYALTSVCKGKPADRDKTLARMMEHAKGHLVHLPGLGPHGFFLGNSQRLYVDCGHPELATSECPNPTELVRQVEAGHQIMLQLATAVQTTSPPETEISVFRAGVEYNSCTHNTWASHENYSMQHMSLDEMACQIIPFLVTRTCLSGSGGFNPFSKGLAFAVSPRASHIEEVISSSSTHTRPIFHLKDEPLCKGYRRLHLLLGDALCSQKATQLRVGSCGLVVALADAGFNPGKAVQLANPVEALHCVAADATCSKPLKLVDGRSMTAIQIQRHYLQMAEAHVGDKFMPDWADVCGLWRECLDRLEKAPGSAADVLDWCTKHELFANHARSLGIRWDELDCMNEVIERTAQALEPLKESGRNMSVERAIALKRAMPSEVRALEPNLRSRGLVWDDVRNLLSHRQSFFELDWRFGQLGSGIFQMLDRAGALNHRIESEDNIARAMAEPPASGRAHVRGKIIQRLAGTGNVHCDWQNIVDFDKGLVLDLSDPFSSEEGSWIPLSTTEIHEGDSAHVLNNIFDFQENPRRNRDRSPYTRRQDAADRILSGDFAGAETLLRGLLQERFILPSTHCHMARVLLMTDRESEAREHIASAWAIRAQADSYVVGRMLFFQLVFAMFDGTEIAGITAQLRSLLSNGDAHLEWTIMPMLDHLQSRLGGPNYEFMSVLAVALSGSDESSCLERFPQWHGAAMSVEGARAAD